MTIKNSLNALQLEFSKVKTIEHQLDDVMELIDISELKVKLKEVEEQFQQEPNELSMTRLGIIYHEAALSLSFLSQKEYKGDAKMSYEVLSEIFRSPKAQKNQCPLLRHTEPLRCLW